jgi:uncharacterized protein YprB with RNaseH-like and TPR domain
LIRRSPAVIIGKEKANTKLHDIQEQLAALRQRIARINHKYAAPLAPRPALPPPVSPRLFIEEYLTGEVFENEHGKHFQTEKLYEHHRRYGSIDVGSLIDLPHDLLGAISNGDVTSSRPEEWAFLDTETTGLAGGSGTYAFLIGIGHITPEGFRVRQFFMRDYGEETSQLAAVAKFLEAFKVLVTYNGKSFDQPLLETRYRMTRQRPPFARLQHLDLLHGVRRLWKLRFDSCRLVELENQVLGIERQGDLPGEMIPYVYFEYLRTHEAHRVVPILHHNVMDIATLAFLTSIVPWAFHGDAASGTKFQHGAELLGLGRWLRKAGEWEQAATLFRRSIDRGLKDALLWPAMWDLAQAEKKLGREAATIAVFSDLAASPNPYRVSAYEELAKYFEHRERNHSMALEMTRSAMKYGHTPTLKKREERLAKRTAQPRPRRLL